MEGRAADRGLDRDRTCSQEVSRMIDNALRSQVRFNRPAAARLGIGSSLAAAGAQRAV
jgi:hypothetical protein